MRDVKRDVWDIAEAGYNRGLEDALEIVVSWHDNGNKPCDGVVMKIETEIRAKIKERDDG